MGKIVFVDIFKLLIELIENFMDIFPCTAGHYCLVLLPIASSVM